jgi:hypothetical protein
MAGAEKFLGAPEAPPRTSETAGTDGRLGFLRTSRMTQHDCCYNKCDRPGTIHIGENGNPDSEWICAYHRDKWNGDRARFLAEGLPCQMKEL